MNKITVTILRDRLSTVITNHPIVVDAIKALSTITLCTDVKFIRKDEDQAIVEFKCPKDVHNFFDTNTHIAKFALEKEY